MSDFPTWTLIESDPGVFTELISKMGVKGVQVQDIWNIDPYSLKRLSPVYGLVFLFKWEASRQRESIQDNSGSDFDSSSVYFARQIVPNACATQAILSILLNCPQIELGDELTTFKSFTGEFPSDLKGEMIGNSELLRTVHNSFNSPDSFISERLSERSKGGEAEAFHFVSYLPIEGQFYELDGLKPSPQRIGECTDDNWIDKAVNHIQEKISSFGSEELRFSLMGVTADRLQTLQGQAEFLKSQIMKFYNPEIKSNSSREEISLMEEQLNEIQEETLEEETRRTKWKKENALRRHNFIPLFLQLIAESSRSGRLGPMVEKAKSNVRKY